MGRGDDHGLYREGPLLLVAKVHDMIGRIGIFKHCVIIFFSF